MKQKYLSLLLALLFLTLSFTACGGKPSTTPAPAQTAAPDTEVPPTEIPEVTPSMESAEERYQNAYEKYDPDMTVMYVDGMEIKWRDFFSWLYNATYQIGSQYYFDSWSEEFPAVVGRIENPTYGGYALSYAFTNAMQCAVIANKANELNVTLTEDQKAELEESLNNYIEAYGGEEGYEEALLSHYLTREYFEFQNEVSVLYTNIFLQMFGEGASKISDEDTISYLKDNGFLIAKHILFSTVDESSNPLEEDKIQEKRELALSVLEELKNCTKEELPSHFDTLMQQYSEDPGSLSYPDGYYFLPGEMVPEFEDAVMALEENDLSDIIESEFGFHIIFIPEMGPDHILGYDDDYEPYTARTITAVEFYNQATSSWYENATVAYANDFENLDLDVLFG